MRGVPAAIADAPSPTSAGVFGIARTTGRPGTSASSVAIVTPAAIDSTSVLARRARRTRSRGVAATSPGFTATTTTSASATAHAALGTTRTFGNCCSSARRRSPSISAIDERVGIPAAVEQAADAAPRPSSRRRAARRVTSREGNRRDVAAACERTRRTPVETSSGPRNLRTGPALPRTGPTLPHLGPVDASTHA